MIGAMHVPSRLDWEGRVSEDEGSIHRGTEERGARLRLGETRQWDR